MTSNDGQHRLHQSYKAGNGSEAFLDSLFVCLFDEGFSQFPLYKVKKRNQKRKTLHKSWSKKERPGSKTKAEIPRAMTLGRSYVQ